MKINSLKILILVCFCYVSVNARNKPVSPAQIPVIGWYGIPAQESTITRYSEMREAGFTMNLSHLSTADEVQTALTAAQKAGMKLIIGRNELHSEPEKTVRRFMNHPALAGYFLRDEPTRNDFQALAEWVKKIQAVDNKHFCYINLLPNYATPEQLGTKTYREYVNTFIKEIPVQILTFDHYPVTGDAQTRVLRPIWYENLEIVADEAQKAGKPFWAFALATSHKPYPIPTIADLRLQVYSNLVYGAQAIQYFTYWTPAAGTWDFHDGPIYNGKKTETYSKVKQVNEEFKGLFGSFSPCQSSFHFSYRGYNSSRHQTTGKTAGTDRNA